MKKSITLCVPGCNGAKQFLDEIFKDIKIWYGTKEEIEADCNIERKWAVSCDNCHKKPVKLKVTVEVRRERL